MSRKSLLVLELLFVAMLSLHASEELSTPKELAIATITTGEYCRFLNSVALSDPHHLYDEKMAFQQGAILRSGFPGSHSYAVAPGEEKELVHLVNWYDQARFCNWVEKGRPSLILGLEEGIYDFEDSFTKKEGALCFLPNEESFAQDRSLKIGNTTFSLVAPVRLLEAENYSLYNPSAYQAMIQGDEEFASLVKAVATLLISSGAFTNVNTGRSTSASNAISHGVSDSTEQDSSMQSSVVMARALDASDLNFKASKQTDSFMDHENSPQNSSRSTHVGRWSHSESSSSSSHSNSQDSSGQRSPGSSPNISSITSNILLKEVRKALADQSGSIFKASTLTQADLSRLEADVDDTESDNGRDPGSLYSYGSAQAVLLSKCPPNMPHHKGSPNSVASYKSSHIGTPRPSSEASPLKFDESLRPPNIKTDFSYNDPFTEVEPEKALTQGESFSISDLRERLKTSSDYEIACFLRDPENLNRFMVHFGLTCDFTEQRQRQEEKRQEAKTLEDICRKKATLIKTDEHLSGMLCHRFENEYTSIAEDFKNAGKSFAETPFDSQKSEEALRAAYMRYAFITKKEEQERSPGLLAKIFGGR